MDTFSIANFLTLGVLVLLQAVLGFDNLLYIALEVKNAPPEKQRYVSNLGIAIAIVLRIILLFIIIEVIKYLQEPFWQPAWVGVFEGSFNFHSIIVLIGGAFITHTAIKEVWHILSLEENDEMGKQEKKPSLRKIIGMIVLMNIIFSFDSILSAMALTNVFWVMAVSIVIGGVLMMWLSGRVTRFLQKNRMFEVMGLFILFLVGIMLLTEGGHMAHISLFGNEVHPLTKTTFYFVIVFLLLVDIVQTRYKRKLSEIKSKRKSADDAEILL